ncbi:MAG TPA: FAD-dependent oxidoreductase, partial [Saprospiraceae bacterium]|nr:FAD-dependent oxidoreductase [Saprospiraceae bacterium]
MRRSEHIAQLQQTARWDMVIIGGGATGLGAALDAAARGYKTLLVERFDFAQGTSSRSTKLIHGGVRYLEQGNINLVKGALRERFFFLKNAPELTRTVPFILPVYQVWKLLYFWIGLKLYDLLSGKLSIGSTRLLSARRVSELMPSVETQGLRGGVMYYDGQFDDSGMCIALAHTA